MKGYRTIIFLLLVFAFPTWGSPPRKGTFLMYQPDGTSFMALLRGDESCKVLMTSDGCAVVKCDDGFYRYASFGADGTLSATDYKAGDNAPSGVLSRSRNIPWNAMRARAGLIRPAWTRSSPSSRRATRAETGTENRHCIVILAQFPDVSFIGGDSRRQDFLDLITKEGNKSVLDYFNDQFQGSCNFEFTIGPIVTLSKNHDYYGKNDDDKAGQDTHPQELVAEACTLADPYVDYTQFDDDGDGIVDNIFVIVAGKSEAEGADADYMWPHQWYVPSLWLDGKRILTYALSTELTVHSQNSSGQLVWGLCTIGTFCHEYSHVLGLYDFYDTDGDGSGGEANGMWSSTSLMDGGNFNDSGRTPPYFNAVDREILGIGNPETLELGTYELEPVDRNGRYLILENPAEPQDFFLFECRAQSGWDAYIGGSGLAIYHIDISKHEAGWSDSASKVVTARYRWEINEINCNPDFECADMVETSSSAMEVRQAFFPYKTITSFTPTSNPAFKFNDGTESPFAIGGITRAGDNVRFTVYKSSEMVPKALDLSAEVYQDAVIISWESDIQGFEGDATVSWGKTSGSRTTVSVQPWEAGKYGLLIEGLSPTTAYSVDVTFTRNGATGETSTVDFLTKATQSSGKPYIHLDYLSSQRSGGKFTSGVGLPLRVYNAIGDKVGWTYNGVAVGPDGSGYFHPSGSGTLKAIVQHTDGTQDILQKEITIQ